MRWGEEITLNFVKVYLKQECLWNSAHESYKNKYIRESAYSEIIKTFKALTGKCMTIPEVKIKIKSLRSTYTQQVQKIMLKSSPDFIYEPSLVWFHEMDWCLKYVPNEKSRTAAVDSSQETQDVDSDIDHVDWCEDEAITSSFEENSDPLIPSLYSDNNYETSATQESTVVLKIEKGCTPEYPNSYIKRKRRKPKKTQYFINSEFDTGTKDDEFDLYGKYIATQLRQMDLQRALNVQVQIQSLIKDAVTSTSKD